jgi:tryptophanyl-tRNA synthetase
MGSFGTSAAASVMDVASYTAAAYSAANTIASLNMNNVAAGIKRKRRILFSQSQVARLEAVFTQQRYLSASDRQKLADEINLKPTQVCPALSNWHENK